MRQPPSWRFLSQCRLSLRLLGAGVYFSGWNSFGTYTPPGAGLIFVKCLKALRSLSLRSGLSSSAPGGERKRSCCAHRALTTPAEVVREALRAVSGHSAVWCPVSCLAQGLAHLF